jgi:hypothetical protein
MRGHIRFGPSQYFIQIFGGYNYSFGLAHLKAPEIGAKFSFGGFVLEVNYLFNDVHTMGFRLGYRFDLF